MQMVQNIENGNVLRRCIKNNKTLSVSDAILLLSEAWEKVTQTTIANRFCHACFKDLSIPSDQEDNTPLVREIQSPTDEDDIPLAQLVAQWLDSSKIEIEEFINVDHDVTVCTEIEEEDILVNYTCNQPITYEEEEQFKLPSLHEAINAAKMLQKYVTLNDDLNSKDNLTALRNMKRKMQNILAKLNVKKQTKMIDFFKS